MRINWPTLIGGMLISGLFFIYIFKLDSSFIFHPDFARDLYEITKITQGDFTLLGPKLTFGGLYTGPYYYYLFAPIFSLTGGQIISILYFNAFLFAIAAGYFYLQTNQHLHWTRALIGTLVIGTLPMIITAARDTYNSYAYLPFLLVWLTYVYFHQLRTKTQFVILGLTMGVIINFHFVNILLLPGLLILLWQQTTVKRLNLLTWFGLGIAVTLMPLLAFELKHQFIMFRNTFIDQSYKAWVQGTNIPGGLSGKSNPITNLWFLLSQMSPLIGWHPIWGLALICFSIKQNIKVVLPILTSLLVFSVVLRFQFIHHYLVSLAMFVVFSTILVLWNTKWWIVLAIFLIMQLHNFPVSKYQLSWRPPDSFDNAAKYAIEHQLIDKHTSFNIMQITRENLLATVGFEYRFFFQKYGYSPNTEFAYQTSDVLLLFSEIPDADVQNFSSWELEQFGKQWLNTAERYHLQDRTIYRLVKHL